MATAIINGVMVTGSVDEIHQLILKAITRVTTAASTNPDSGSGVQKNAPERGKVK